MSKTCKTLQPSQHLPGAYSAYRDNSADVCRGNPIGRQGEIFLQPRYHSWHWPQSKTNCTVLQGSSGGSASLLKLDAENRRAAELWVGAVFFWRCRWIFWRHFHLSGWVLHVMDWSNMCCCSVITNTVAKPWFILMLGTLKKRACFIIACFY